MASCSRATIARGEHHQRARYQYSQFETGANPRLLLPENSPHSLVSLIVNPVRRPPTLAVIGVPRWLRAVGLQLPEANTIKRLCKSSHGFRCCQNLTAYFLNQSDQGDLQSKISRGELVLLYKGADVPGISGLAEKKMPQFNGLLAHGLLHARATESEAKFKILREPMWSIGSNETHLAGGTADAGTSRLLPSSSCRLGYPQENSDIFQHIAFRNLNLFQQLRPKSARAHASNTRTSIVIFTPEIWASLDISLCLPPWRNQTGC